MASLALLALMLLWIRLWLTRQDLTDGQLLKRVGTMIDGYKQEKDSLVRQEWFIIRRVMFAAAAFFALDHIWLSFSVIFLCTLLTIIANF